VKIISVAGARPEFIQSMPISRVLRQSHHEILVHTGQHYDYLMSQAFFDELDIPAPDYDLEVGSGLQGYQTARILEEMEKVLLREHPDLVIVRGDTNSTLAAALAASKLNLPLAHIEAGERSYNRKMPEEINRIVTDRLSTIYFCASAEAVSRLREEGIQEAVYWVGDVMLDALNLTLPVARRKSNILSELDLQSKKYSLVTIHRSTNTDDPFRLEGILAALNSFSETVIFPVHPRTRKSLLQIKRNLNSNIRAIDPVGYFDMIVLEENARLIATDSGGVQREAYFLKIPCLTLRDETEWIATVHSGWNRLVGADREKIIDAWFTFQPPIEYPLIFGDGRAAERIVQVINTLATG
jgi:UDP-N-acetylglucosamine 2-epimerase